MENKYKYDVAISFAEEDRNAALALSLALEISGIHRVYYYPDRIKETIGGKLRETLESVYSSESQYVIILLSKKYFTKPVALMELNAIQKRFSRNQDTVFVIAVRLSKQLSHKNYPFLQQIIYTDWNYAPKDVAATVIKKLGKKNRDNREGNDYAIIQLNKLENNRVGKDSVINQGNYLKNPKLWKRKGKR